MPKNTSTKLSHDPDVGVKCKLTRGWRASQRSLSISQPVGGLRVVQDVGDFFVNEDPWFNAGAANV
jgi:hypothetical protein